MERLRSPHGLVPEKSRLTGYRCTPFLEALEAGASRAVRSRQSLGTRRKLASVLPSRSDGPNRSVFLASVDVRLQSFRPLGNQILFIDPVDSLLIARTALAMVLSSSVGKTKTLIRELEVDIC